MNLHKLDKNGEFCCKNGLCIDSENRCDNSMDCVDHTDEEHCELVTFPFQYNEKNPPTSNTIKRFPTLNKQFSTRVEVSMELLNIFDINEVTSEVSIIFNILLKWRDPRLKFVYLKDDTDKNVIEKSVWIPELFFGNLKEQVFVSKKNLK